MKPTRLYIDSDCAEWIERERNNCDKGLADDKSVPEWMRDSDHFKKCWYAGCWLNTMLEAHGASKDEVFQIGFAHGQRSVFGDTVRVAVAYLNEFILSGDVSEKPGIELGDKINKEFIATIK